MIPDSLVYQNSSQTEYKKPFSAVLIMVCIYMFLVIDRPWESIRYLEGISIERTYAIILILVAFFQNKFKIVSCPTNKWVYGLLSIHFVLAPFAFNTGAAIDQGIEYAKNIVLYLLFLSCCDEDADLKFILKAFVVTMAIYVFHSFWEFINGRMTYRMGIVRMLGVGDTYSDPNSFAASIVLSLPFVWTVFKSETQKWFRWAYIAYALLGAVCIVLTGSRSGMLALLLLLVISIAIQKGSQRFKLAAVALLVVFVAWSFVPAAKQERIRSIWDAEAGPENAHMSTHGRYLGFHAGIQMFNLKPLTGIGAGPVNFIRYRAEHIDGIPEQAHNLIGEVLGEFGVPGAVAFLGLIFSTVSLFWKARKQESVNGLSGSFLHRLSGAGLVVVFILFFLGFGGHNFYRPMWLWLAAWASLAYLFAEKKGLITQEYVVESEKVGLPPLVYNDLYGTHK